MKNFTIFAVQEIRKDSLYTIVYGDSFDKYENHEFDESDCAKKNEFSRIFENWSDVEYLEAFFESNKDDLHKEFYNYISIDDAIQITLDEAEKLEKSLLSVAKKGETDQYENLQTLFKPLNKIDEAKYPIPDYQKSKLYGESHKSWLRIYALRIDKNLFFITGAAIKLTETMNEREHLLKELEKLEIVKNYLIKNEIIDIDSLIEFIEL